MDSLRTSSEHRERGQIPSPGSRHCGAAGNWKTASGHASRDELCGVDVASTKDRVPGRWKGAAAQGRPMRSPPFMGRPAFPARQPAGVDRRHGSAAGRRRRTAPRAALRTRAALRRLPDGSAVPAPGAAVLPEAFLLVQALRSTVQSRGGVVALMFAHMRESYWPALRPRRRRPHRFPITGSAG